MYNVGDVPAGKGYRTARDGFLRAKTVNFAVGIGPTNRGKAA